MGISFALLALPHFDLTRKTFMSVFKARKGQMTFGYGLAIYTGAPCSLLKLFAFVLKIGARQRGVFLGIVETII